METTKAKKYTEAIGRRKTSVARVRLSPATKGNMVINGKDLPLYFKTEELRSIAKGSLEKSGMTQKFSISVKAMGGGVHAQAEAIRLGIARAILKIEPEQKIALKKEGFLRRDSRKVERKKFGLKKARKSPKWSKR